jgi:hypothetical protein
MQLNRHFILLKLKHLTNRSILFGTAVQINCAAVFLLVNYSKKESQNLKSEKQKVIN